MKKGIAKFTAFCLSAGFIFTQGGALVMADEVSENAAVHTDVIGTNGFAQCSEYLNVRASADQEGELVGIIPNDGIMEILDVDEHGWYLVKSGNVKGYVASQFVATGSEADKIAATAGYTTAEVGAISLNVRAEASDTSEVVGAVEEKEEVEVVADYGDWIKVVLDNGIYGYVSHDYVYVSTEYRMGETLAEVQARLDAENNNSDDFCANSINAGSTSSDRSYADGDYTEDSSSDGSYVNDSYTEDSSSDESYTDDSYTEDTSSDESVDTDYTEDSSSDDVYVDDSYTEDSSSDDSYVDDSYTEDSSSDDSYVDDGYTEGSSSDDSYVDDSYTEDSSSDNSYADDDYTGDISSGTEAPAASSTGQAIADYACQFVGNPYVWGGTSLTNGADCSGFTMSVFANFGISLPHNAASQSGYGTAVSADTLQAGDLVFYSDGSGISHVAIYIGGGQIVHAANSTSGIIISSMYYDTPTCYRRLV